MQIGKKTKSVLIFSILLCSLFASLTPPVSADGLDFSSDEFSDLSKIYWNSTAKNASSVSTGNVTFAKTILCNGSGKNMSSFTVNFDNISKTLTFHLEQEMYDDEGWPVEGNSTINFLVNKTILNDTFNISAATDIAVRDYYFRSCDENGSFTATEKDWYCIPIEICIDEDVIIKPYPGPILNEKWYTKGTNDSIRLKDRAMFIKQTVNSTGHVMIGFSHPANTNGQEVYINKSWLSNRGISAPYFEWGHKTPWKQLGYSENETHYIVNPEHFSNISVHQEATGEAHAYNKLASSTTKTYTLKEIKGTDIVETGYTNELTRQVSGSVIYAPQDSEITTYQRIIDYDVDEFLVAKSSNVALHIRFQTYGNAQARYTPAYYRINGVWESKPSNSNCANGWGTRSSTKDLTDVDQQIGIRYHAIAQYPASWSIAKFRTIDIDSSTLLPGTGDPKLALVTLESYYYNCEYSILSRTVNRTWGLSSESNEFNWTGLPTNYSGDAIIAVPVSASCTGVVNVTNITSSTYLSEVTSFNDINETCFYYDSPNQVVYFCVPISDTQHHYYVNMTHGTSFEISPPSYLRSGDNFACRGVVFDADGYTLNGILAETTIRGLDYADNDSFYTSNISEDFSGTNDWNLDNTTIMNSKLNLTGNELVGHATKTFPYLSDIDSISFVVLDRQWQGDIRYNFSINGTSWFSLSGNGSIDFPGNGSSLYVDIFFHLSGSPPNPNLYVDDIEIEVTVEQYLVDDQVLVSAKWNCSNGNYECDMATTSLIPGLYNWQIDFYDVGVGISFKKSGPLWIDIVISGGDGGGTGGPYASAHLYYSFFDLNTGTGFDDNYFKFYISPDTTFNEGDRVKGGMKPTYLGQTLYYKILDFFNNTMYPSGETYSTILIDSAETYIDCGVNMRQFRVKNMNESTIYFIIRDDSTDLQVGRWIPPYEEATYFLLDNTYNLTLQYYNSATSALEQTVYIPSFVIDSDTFYWIPGYSLADIVIVVNNANMTIMDQIINIGVNINNDGSTVINQIINSNVVLSNINSNISLQHIDTRVLINNTYTNISQQVNSVWFSVNNTNTSMNEQANLIKQTITNTESNITNQISGVLQNVTNINSTVINQANLVQQQITNVEANITNQVNSMWQGVNNSNTTIHNQLNIIDQSIQNSNTTILSQINVVRQDISNMNGSIDMQLNTITQNITNMNLSIDTQMNALSQDITNMNSSINVQFNGITSKITNFESNITTQVNSVWASVNNSNTSMHYQLNVVSADITNMNSSVHTQINLVSTKITNVETNITNQFNQLDVMIMNMESNLTNQINAINISIVNNNTNITNQLNAILINISNANTTIVEQANLITTTITNTESNITTQLNGINTMIVNSESNITSQINIVLINISNSYTNITSQLNVINTQITNVETNLTNQFNYIEVQLSNTETNITNQINFINTTITNVNGSIQTQLNTILTKIENTNLSMIDQINLIWNEINTTNSTVHTQVIGVNTKITTMWSNVNYSFTVIESNISYMNTTIVNLITDMNATLLAHLTNVLDNVSESGVSVFTKVTNVLANLSQINTSLHDEIIGQALDIMGDLDVLNTNLTNMTLAILENISNINVSFNGTSIQELLNLTQELQQDIASNFSYISNRIDAVQTQIDIRITTVLDAIDAINLTGYNDMIALLEGILEQFELPHEWRIPSINYSINDTIPPISSIAASSALGGGINVRWASTDNNPFYGVSYTTIYFRVVNASWRVWKPVALASGSEVFSNETQTLVNDTEYWFKCIGTDHAGNVENESDSNICNITYIYRAMPTSGFGDGNSMIMGTFANALFWILIIGLIIFAVIIGMRKKQTRKKIINESLARKTQIYREDVF